MSEAGPERQAKVDREIDEPDQQRHCSSSQAMNLFSVSAIHALQALQFHSTESLLMTVPSNSRTKP